MIKTLSTLDELREAACDDQATEEEFQTYLAKVLSVVDKFDAEGIFLARCEMMDSSYRGEINTLPYGGSATFREPPTQPFSPRGLASDTSVAFVRIPAEALRKSTSK